MVTDVFVASMLSDTFLTILTIVGPILLAAVVVGLTISIFQATTQIQEQTLTFAPKFAIILLAILLMSPFIVNTMTDFTNRIFEEIQDIR